MPSSILRSPRRLGGRLLGSLHATLGHVMMTVSDGLFESGKAVSLLWKNKRCYAYLEGVGVHASGASVEEALESLSARYLELQNFARETELPLSLLRPVSAGGRDRLGWRGLRVVVLSVVAFALMMLPLSYALSTALTRTATNLKITGGAAFWQSVEEGLLRAASESEGMSAQEKEKITTALRVLTQRYKPYLDEVRPLFTGEPMPRATSPVVSSPGAMP